MHDNLIDHWKKPPQRFAKVPKDSNFRLNATLSLRSGSDLIDQNQFLFNKLRLATGLLHTDGGRAPLVFVGNPNLEPIRLIRPNQANLTETEWPGSSPVERRRLADLAAFARNKSKLCSQDNA